MITKFQFFLEAIYPGLSFNNIDYDLLYNKSNFIDGELIKKFYLEKYNDKEIIVTWYNTHSHEIKEKIKNRTSAESIEQFNEIVKKYLIKLFNICLDELLVKMSDKDLNRIAVEIPDLKTNLIIEYNPDKLCNDPAFINVLTVVPFVTSMTINRTFRLK